MACVIDDDGVPSLEDVDYSSFVPLNSGFFSGNNEASLSEEPTLDSVSPEPSNRDIALHLNEDIFDSESTVKRNILAGFDLGSPIDVDASENSGNSSPSRDTVDSENDVTFVAEHRSEFPTLQDKKPICLETAGETKKENQHSVKLGRFRVEDDAVHIPATRWIAEDWIQRDKATGLFVVGNMERKLCTARDIRIHWDGNLCLDSLETSPHGILHVIVQRHSSALANEMVYRFQPWGSWSGPVRFLRNKKRVTKRRLKCKAVKICPLAPSSFRNAQHGSRKEYNDLQGYQTRMEQKPRPSPEISIRRARSLALHIISQGRYCRFVRPAEFSTGSLFGGPMCEGEICLRVNSSTGQVFAGCSKYRNQDRFAYVRKKGNDLNELNYCGFDDVPVKSRKHVSYDLKNLDEPAREALVKWVREGEVPPLSGETCCHISMKGQKSKLCPEHGTVLQESGDCSVEFIIMEPVKQAAQDMGRIRCADVEHDVNGSYGTDSQSTNNDDLVLFVVALGVHNHPPPPPPRTSVRRDKLILEEISRNRGASASVIKKRVQERLLKGGATGSGLSVIDCKVYSLIKSMKKRGDGTMAQQSESMVEMASNREFEYVREMQMSECGGLAFLLASNEMLEHAAMSVALAGDATFKMIGDEVSSSGPEPIRVVSKVHWYLYNVVARTFVEGLGSKGVVVARVFMTRLTATCYKKAWGMLISHMRACHARRLGVNPDRCKLKLPYIRMDPEDEDNSIEIRAITTDFDQAEIEGIASALAEIKGGSSEYHAEHVMSGCYVHFERDARKRAARLGGEAGQKLYEGMIRLHTVRCMDLADKIWHEIYQLDPTWADWVLRSPIKYLAIPAYSKMSDADRAVGFSDTNIVESQNRRGNHICGIGLHPAVAVKELHTLDEVAIKEAIIPRVTPKAVLPRPRRRFTTTVVPCSGSAKTGKKRARRTPLGPTQPRKIRKATNLSAVAEPKSSEFKGNTMDVSHTSGPGGTLHRTEANSCDDDQPFSAGENEKELDSLQNRKVESSTPKDRGANITSINAGLVIAEALERASNGDDEEVISVLMDLYQEVESINTAVGAREAINNCILNALKVSKSKSTRQVLTSILVSIKVAEKKLASADATHARASADDNELSSPSHEQSMENESDPPCARTRSMHDEGQNGKGMGSIEAVEDK